MSPIELQAIMAIAQLAITVEPAIKDLLVNVILAIHGQREVQSAIKQG
jgi:hypothetical protein